MILTVQNTQGQVGGTLRLARRLKYVQQFDRFTAMVVEGVQRVGKSSALQSIVGSSSRGVGTPPQVTSK